MKNLKIIAYILRDLFFAVKFLAEIQWGEQGKFTTKQFFLKICC